MGRFEVERKVHLTLTLGTHAGYQEARTTHREARLKLADAERRIELARQQCRLLREAVRIGATVED